MPQASCQSLVRATETPEADARLERCSMCWQSRSSNLTPAVGTDVHRQAKRWGTHLESVVVDSHCMRVRTMSRGFDKGTQISAAMCCTVDGPHLHFDVLPRVSCGAP